MNRGHIGVVRTNIAIERKGRNGQRRHSHYLNRAEEEGKAGWEYEVEYPGYLLTRSFVVRNLMNPINALGQEEHRNEHPPLKSYEEHCTSIEEQISEAFEPLPEGVP